MTDKERRAGDEPFGGTFDLDPRGGEGDEWNDVMAVPEPVQPSLINRFKVMAKLDAARRPAQEGAFRVRLRGQDHTVTIAVVKVTGGDEARMRLAPSHDARE